MFLTKTAKGQFVSKPRCGRFGSRRWGTVLPLIPFTTPHNRGFLRQAADPCGCSKSPKFASKTWRAASESASARCTNRWVPWPQRNRLPPWPLDTRTVSRFSKTPRSKSSRTAARIRVKTVSRIRRVVRGRLAERIGLEQVRVAEIHDPVRASAEGNTAANATVLAGRDVRECIAVPMVERTFD